MKNEGGENSSSAAADGNPVVKVTQLSGPTSIEDTVLRDETDGRLWRHIAGLPERCRTLLRVIAFADRPDYAELARALGMPQGSIGPTRGRCLAKLRLALAQDPNWEHR